MAAPGLSQKRNWPSSEHARFLYERAAAQLRQLEAEAAAGKRPRTRALEQELRTWQLLLEQLEGERGDPQPGELAGGPVVPI